MPPDNDIKGTVHIYLCIDEEKKEIFPIPVWCGTSDADVDSFVPKLEPIETTCRILWKHFMNNKKARLRKQQIMRSIHRKTVARCYPKWLEAKGTYGQMPFSWMAYWYRRLEHEKVVR